MAAPRIDRLFDHTVRIWRPTADANNRLGVEKRTYALVASVGCAMNRAVAPEGDIGPGMVPIGRRRFYLRPDANVKARDVVEIIAGSSIGEKWEVDQNPEKLRSHHTQVDAIAWNGILPEVGS